MKSLTAFPVILILLLPLQILPQTGNHIRLMQEQFSKDKKKSPAAEFLITNSIHQDWVNTEWVNFTRQSYTYDLSNNRIEDLTSNWLSGSWNNLYRFTYSYDEDNNKIDRLNQTWDVSGWMNIGKHFYSYSYNLLSEDLWKTWDGSGWVNAGEITVLI